MRLSSESSHVIGPGGVMLGAGGHPALRKTYNKTAQDSTVEFENHHAGPPLCRCKKANQFRVALAELETYFKVA